MNKVLQIIIRARDTTSRAFGTIRRRLQAVGRVAKDIAKGVAVIGGAIGGAVTGLGLLARRGGEVLNVQGAFARVTGDSAAALQKLQGATRGLISDFDLMQGFNQAIALGSARNVDEFARMSRVALALSRTLGIDAKFALESLNTGIARQSKLFLDNLGIIVNVEEANARYAAQLGKTAAELTDLEKREAFRAAALDAAERAVSKLGTGSVTAGDKVTQFMTRLRNFRDEIGKIIATSPAVADFFDTLTQALETLSQKMPGIIERLAEFGRTALSIFDPVGARVAQEIAGIRAQGNAGDPRFLRARLGFAERELGRLILGRGRIEAELERFTGGRSIQEMSRNEIERAVPFSRLGDVNRFFQLQEDIQVSLRVIDFIRGELDRLAAERRDNTDRAAGGTLRLPSVGPPRLVSSIQLRQPTVPAETLTAIRHTSDEVKKGAEGFEDAGATFVAAIGSMAEAAIQGGEITAQSVVGMITDIVRSIPGVGGFAGSVIGAVGGVLGALLGTADRDRPVPVRVTDFDREAERKLQPRREGPDTRQPIIIDAATGRRVDEVEYQLRRRTRTDAVPRFVDQRPGGAG
ncbi:MAG TPA: hypothetical protein VF158_15850 [Longimicrobiales bacterium]